MNTKQEITDLTVCRALFAVWVFVYHVDLYLNFSAWLGPFSGLIRHGYLGVDGFFLLSGLILARVHPELARPSLKDALKFWGKRLARIYPVHLATIVLFAAVLLAGQAHGLTPRDPQRFSIPSLMQNLFLVHGWGLASQGDWNYPSWSVSTEWAGYLLFPVLWFVVSYFDVIVSVQIVIVFFTLLGLIAVRYHGLNLSFSGGLVRFFPEFIIGAATARFVPNIADFLPRRVFAAIGAVIIFLCAMEGFDYVGVFGLWLVLFSLTMQVDAQAPAMLGRSPFLHRLGLMSYAFYMSFAFAELLTTQCFRQLGWTPVSHSPLFAGGMLTLTVALSIFLHLVIERPSRRAADRWLDAPAPGLLSLTAKQL